MSLVDGASVSQKSVIYMLAYLLLLCLSLGFGLVTFWPNPYPLVISNIEPSQGASQESVTILGSGFTNEVAVLFDDLPGTTEKVESSTAVIKLPNHPVGPSAVTVKDRNGQAVTIPDGFTFTSANLAQDSSKQHSTPPTNDSSAKEHPSAQPLEHRSLAASSFSRVSILPVFSIWLRENVRALLIVMIVGALGSLIHVFRSFYWYVGNRNLRNSWLLMYILLPFGGAGLAVLFYLIIRGGISAQAPPNPASIDGYAAVAALVGMFSQEALLKLRQIAGAFFTPAEAGKDPAIQPLKIKAVTPTAGPSAGGTKVILVGTGFGPNTQVSFGGIAATSLAVVDATEVSVNTPPHPAGPVDVEATNSAGQKSVLPQAYTFQ